MYAVKLPRADDVRRELAELCRRGLSVPGEGDGGPSFDFFEVGDATFSADRSSLMDPSAAPHLDHLLALHRDADKPDTLGSFYFGAKHGYRFRSAARTLLSGRTSRACIQLGDYRGEVAWCPPVVWFAVRPAKRGGRGATLRTAVFFTALNAVSEYPFARAWHLYVQERMLDRLRRDVRELTTEHAVFHVASLYVPRHNFRELEAATRKVFAAQTEEGE